MASSPRFAGCLVLLLAAGCRTPAHVAPTSVSQRESSGTARVAAIDEADPWQEDFETELIQHVAAQRSSESGPPDAQRSGSQSEAQSDRSPGGEEASPGELQPGVGEIFMEPPPIPDPPRGMEAAEEAAAGMAAGAKVDLEQLEHLACQHNPTLVQAKVQVDATFGKAIQAGLWPNPELMYVAEQIGVMNTPGEFHGGIVRQKIVTADKRDLSRSKFLERTKTAEWMAMAQEYRVLNDVRIHYFRTLARQELVAIEKELLKNAEDNLVTFREMYNVGQATRPEVHQANVQLQEQRLSVLMAENDFLQSWETLTALVGVDLAPSALDGALDGDLAPIEWDQALTRLLSESPELQAAWSKLRADQITLKREKVEPIPNLVVEGGAGHNYEAGETVGSASLSLEIPLFDWNQGTVRQAQADLVRQQSEIRRTELVLRRRLAEQYRQYLTAIQHVENYRDVILPEARLAYEELLDSYEDDRVRWTDVLDAERNYFRRRAIYIDNLMAWRESEVLIIGYLLHGGLEAPARPTPPGHIDAVANPR